MKRFSLTALVSAGLLMIAVSSKARENENLQALQAHFEQVTQARFDTVFSSVGNLEQWGRRKAALRNALAKMLWNDRGREEMPPAARITHRVEAAGYRLECIVLETAPGIYSTSNLYLPKTGNEPYPVVLYQCGHANKNAYKIHGAWLAARGIAVLMMDNIEMGEMEFTHHGVYSNARFDWYSRGFSPLAAELFNARRNIDYIIERKDLDNSRIGATGISGGGMTTFFLAALDERIVASAPVSGAISTRGWVEKSLSSLHCDCQFPVNSHGLIYSEIGAMVAPRVQLLCNSSDDRGFPMDSFSEMYDKMMEIYALHGAGAALDTAIAPGGHADKESIRLPVYSFFLKQFLALDTTLTAEGPVDTLGAEELVCLRDGLPINERFTRIDEELVPPFAYEPGPRSAQELRARSDQLKRVLREEVFRYLPTDRGPLLPELGGEKLLRGRTVRPVSFDGFPGLRVRGILSMPGASETGSGKKYPAVILLDHRRGIPVWGNEQPLEAGKWGERAVLVLETLDRGSRVLENNLRSFRDNDPLHHMKRQAMVCGTTLDAMAVYEVLRALEFMRSLPGVDPERITVMGKGETGINGLYAAFLDGAAERVILQSPPASHRQGPSYLDVLRYTDIPEMITLMAGKVEVYGEKPLSLRLSLEKACRADEIFAGGLEECLP